MITVHRASNGEACEIDSSLIESVTPYSYRSGPLHREGAKVIYEDGSCLKVQETPEQIKKIQQNAAPKKVWSQPKPEPEDEE